jgi:uncharacterized repeat protein (TIGR01451 family)/fimbrial isopeptide formation D2 family protein
VAALVAVVALLGGLLSTTAAQAAGVEAVHQITGDWLGGTPASVPFGGILTAEYKVNTNDANDPPGNSPVTNVTVTLVATNGTFSSIPTICLTTTTPPSSISTDGSTLTCDVGTVIEGTSTVIDAPLLASSKTGGAVSVSGTVTSDDAVAPFPAPAVLPPVPVTYKNGMDLALASTANQNYEGTITNGRQQMLVDFSVILGTGSSPGPANYSFPLTISTPTPGGDLTGIAFDGCGPVTNVESATGPPAAPTAGVPFSDTSFSDRDNFPGCSVTPTSGTSYTVSLSGLDYTLTHVPVDDSTGAPLPNTGVWIASGTLAFSRPTVTLTTVYTYTATPPDFTFAMAPTSVADTNATDNSASVTLIPPGAFSDEWAGTPTDGRSPWDTNLFVQPGVGAGDQYPVPGATISNYSNYPLGLYMQAQDNEWDTYQGVGGATLASTCTINQNPTDFIATNADYGGLATTGDQEMTTAELYYTTAPLNATTETCNEPLTGSIWTQATPVNGTPGLPGDPRIASGTSADDLVDLPAGVTAIRMVWNPAVDKPQETIVRMFGYISPTAASTAEGWTVGAFNYPDSETSTATTFTNGNNAALFSEVDPTPWSTFAPWTTDGRDPFRIVGDIGTISKKASDTTANPGVPVTYTLTSQAVAPSSVTDPVPATYTVVDTLPAGMTYVAGSGSPTPAVSGQTLTFTYTNATPDTNQVATYEAETSTSTALAPGTTLTNTAVVNVPGDSRPVAAREASASVVTPSASNTTFGKSVEASVLSYYGDTSAWDLTINSQDPLSSTFTDTIDVLPYSGDGRGTNITGSYTIGTPAVPAGSLVYYTTAAPASVSNNPSNLSNGYAAGSVTGNTVGWTTTRPANASSITAVRVIGPALAPGAVQNIRIPFTTSAPTGTCTAPAATDNRPGQSIVNSAGSIAQHTALVMLSSATTKIGACYALDIKKYVAVPGGDPSGPVTDTADWADANTVADYPQYAAGATVPYQVVVTNAGGALSNITVADPQAPGCGGTIATLAANAAQSFTCTMTAVVGTTVNTATATVTPPSSVDGTTSPPINVSDPAGIVVPEQMVVFKSVVPVSGSPATPGSTVKYTVTVTEPAGSAAPWIDPKLTDDLSGVLDDATFVSGSQSAVSSAGTGAPDAGTVVPPASGGSTLSWSSGKLMPGETVTITYAVKVNSPDTGDAVLANTVTTPPGTSNCSPPSTDPACSTSNPVPGINIVKTASEPAANPGDKVTYTVTLTNTGQVAYPATGSGAANFTDSLIGDLDDATYNNDAVASGGAGTVSYAAPVLSWSGPLAIGATETITYSVTVNNPDSGPHSLVNTVTSTSAGNNCELTSKDPACSTTTPVSGLSIVKSASPTTVSKLGQSVSYRFLVTNTGETTLTNVSVTDTSTAPAGPLTAGPTCPAAASSLAPGASVTCTGTYLVTQADMDNGSILDAATATGTTKNLPPITTPPSPATVHVTQKPATSIVKSAVASTGNTTTLTVGETIKYSYVVTNTGNVTLTSVAVNDPTLGAVTCPVPAAPGLAPGASEICTANTPHVVTQSDVNAGKVTDTATSTGTDPKNQVSPPSPPSTVVIPQPAKPTVAIVKSGQVTPAKDQRAAKVGDKIAYSYKVTNIGNVDLKTVAVDDPTLGAVTCPVPAAPGLVPGASETCTANKTHTVTQADVNAGKVVDTATATGTDNQGGTSPKSPPSTVTIPTVTAASKVGLVKTATVDPAADQGGAKVGDTITYTFKVTNIGNVTLKSVAVSDPSGGAVTCPVPAAPGLAPGASETCTGNTPHTVSATDVTAGHVTDTATATGVDTRGQTSPLSDPSTAVVPTVSTLAAATPAPSAPNGLGAIITDLGRWSSHNGPGMWGIGGGAGLIALGGLGLGIGRRRRRRIS